MTQEHPDWQYLDLTFSHFGRPSIDNKSISLPVRDLWISKGFRGYEQEQRYPLAAIIFEDVASSKRGISEYGAPEERDGRRFYSIERNYTVTDGPFEDVDRVTFTFYLGGISYDPHGWIEWYIEAADFRIEV